MHHGLNQEQIRELSRCWAIYDHHEETYRFLTGCWSPLDFTFAIDGIEWMWGYEPEFVGDSVRRSILTSAVDGIPVGSPVSARSILRLIKTDRELLKRLIRVIASGPENKELDTEFYMDALEAYCRSSEKPEPVVSLPDEDTTDYEVQMDAFRATISSFISGEETPCDEDSKSD